MSRRLQILLLVLAALAVLNWLDAAPASEDGAVVLAVPEKASVRQAQAAAAPAQPASGPVSLPKPLLAEPSGDPFARAVAPVNLPAPIVPPPAVVPVVAPAPPAPPPMPSFALTAIGRWEQDGEVSVFFQHERTTLSGKLGDELPGGFTLTQIDATSFQVTHIPTGEVVTRPIGAASPAGAAYAQGR